MAKKVVGGVIATVVLLMSLGYLVAKVFNPVFSTDEDEQWGI